MTDEIKLIIGKNELIGAITGVKHIGNSKHSEVDINIATLHVEAIPLKDGKIIHELRPDITSITVTVPTETIMGYLVESPKDRKK